MSDMENKVVFAVSLQGQGDGIPVVLLGIPARAWEHMKDGNTHTFDLTRAGVPVKLILYGARTHRDAMAVIETHSSLRGEPLLDARDRDFSIHPKKNQTEEI